MYWPECKKSFNLYRERNNFLFWALFAVLSWTILRIFLTYGVAKVYKGAV